MGENRRVAQALTAQVEWWWRSTFRPRLDGLTDDEFFWHPTGNPDDDCWTLRPQPDGTTLYDHRWPPPLVAPVTTIAWRVCHIAVGCLAVRTARYFPDHAPRAWTQQPYEGPLAFPATADGAVSFLDEWWAGWRAGLDATTDEQLFAPLGPEEGDFSDMQLGADDPFVGIVLHVHRELLHHGAEINLLRDLYRAEQQPDDKLAAAILRGDARGATELMEHDPGSLARTKDTRPHLVLRAAEAGNVDAVRLALELGFDVDSLSDKTAAHYAAAANDLDLLRVLVDAGADLTLTDPEYGATPLGWAEFFKQDDAAAYLRSL